MAESVVDIPINNLAETLTIGDTDLIVIQQGEDAVKASGATLKAWLYEVSQAHGMIQSIEKVGTSGLVDTHRITLADGTTYDFSVTQGNGIESITAYFALSSAADATPTSWSTAPKLPTPEQKYLWTYNYIHYTDGTSKTSKKYVCSVYGDQGVKGDPPAYVSGTREYQVSESGTDVPTGEWLSTIPNVPQGKYLWVKVVENFETGSTEPVYSVSRAGVDGSGSVSSVANVSPDASGNVPLTATHLGALPTSGGTMAGEIKMSGQPISGLNQPTEDTQAANKAYVDKAVHSEAISVRGDDEKIAFATSSVEIVPVDTVIAGSDGHGFTFADGGVKMPKDGLVLVSGAVYMAYSASDEVWRGVYVKKNNAEISTTYGTGKVYGAVGSPAVIIPISAGDVLHLAARCTYKNSSGTWVPAGYYHPSDPGTHLDIMYI